MSGLCLLQKTAPSCCRAGILAVKVAVPLAVLLLLACAAAFVAVREPRLRGFRRYRDHKTKRGGGSDGAGSDDDGKRKVSTEGATHVA